MSVSVRNTRFAALALSALACLPATAHEAHVHGIAALDVTIDNQQLTLNLHSPLANLIGFEHAPNTDKDRQAVRDMAARLRKPGVSFVPAAAAKCSLTGVKLSAGPIPAHLLGEPEHTTKQKHTHTHDHQHAPGDAHADLTGTYVYSCANMHQLQYIDVPLLTAFTGFNRLDVQVVTPTRQQAATLNASSNRIQLK